MAVLYKRPDVLSLSGNLKPFEMTSASNIRFKLFKGETLLLDHSYAPGEDDRVQIDVKQIVESNLTFLLKADEPGYLQPDLAANFKAQIDDEEYSFRVIRSGVDNLVDTTYNWLKLHFLTWQPVEKKVTYYSPEWLTYYAVDDCSIKIHAYFPDGTDEEKVLLKCKEGNAYTVDVQYGCVARLYNNKLPMYYDVLAYFGIGQITRSEVQRYMADSARSEDEEWISWENSLGGYDTARVYGVNTFSGEHTHNISFIDDTASEYDVETKRKYSKNTGHLNKYERQWLLDFFPSRVKYVYTGNTLRRIVVTEDNVTYKSTDLPSSYTFTFQYTDTNPYLNLQKKENLPAGITIPVPDLPDFTLPPRIIEYPRIPLSEGVLFPVQDPNSERLGVTTFGEIKKLTGIGTGSLGNLVNVGSWADAVPSFDRLMVQLSGSTHWTEKRLSEIVGFDTEALEQYLTANSYAKITDIPTNHITTDTFTAHVNSTLHLTEEQRTVLSKLKVDASGRLYTEESFYSLKSIAARRTGNTGIEAAYGSLGSLLNVGVWADTVPSASRIMVQIAGATHWSSKLLSEVVGLDTSALLQYLTTNNYAQKTDIPSLSGYATETYVTTRINNLVNGAPAAFDTLKEIADILQGNVSSIGDILTALGTKWTQDNTKISNWDTAYSWGNHASAGYLTAAEFALYFKKDSQGRIYTDSDFYSTKSVGARGTSGSSSGGGGGLIKSVYAYADLGKAYSDASLTDTFNAYTIDKIHNRLKIVETQGLDTTSLEAYLSANGYYNSTNLNTVILGGAINANAFPYNEVGYGYSEQGWCSAGPAISIGTTAYVLQLQNGVGTDNIYFRSVNNNSARQWHTIYSTANANLPTENWTANGFLLGNGHGLLPTTWGAGLYNPTLGGSYFSAGGLVASDTFYDTPEVPLNGILSKGYVWSKTGLLIGEAFNSVVELNKGAFNSLRIKTPTGLLDIGSHSEAYMHFSTERDKYHFNKPVYVSGQIYAGAMYDKIVLHSGNSSSTPNWLTTAGRHYELDLRHSDYNQNVYYPVTAMMGTAFKNKFYLVETLSARSKPAWSTHQQGFSVALEWSDNGNGYGTIDISRTITRANYLFSNQSACGGIGQLGFSSTEIVWVRGGGVYSLYIDGDSTAPIIHKSDYTILGQTAYLKPLEVAKADWDNLYYSSSGFYSVGNISVPGDALFGRIDYPRIVTIKSYSSDDGLLKLKSATGESSIGYYQNDTPVWTVGKGTGGGPGLDFGWWSNIASKNAMKLSNSGTLNIYPTSVNYTEGIRVANSSNNWSLILFGAVGDEGTSVNSWMIGKNDANDLIFDRNHSVGNTGNGMKLDVNRSLSVNNNIVANRGYVISELGWIQTSSSGTGLYNDAENARLYASSGVWHADKSISSSGYLTGSRVFCGYDSAVAGSVSCSNWFRSNGATGWYNSTYSGGIYMEDNIWVRVYGNKRFRVENTAGDSIFTTGGITAMHNNPSNSWANWVKYPTPFRMAEATVVAGNYCPVLSWSTLTTGGYRQHASLGSLREANNFGAVYITVSQDDNNTASANFGFGSSGNFYNPNKIFANSICAGYDSNMSGSINSSGWFRSSGGTGWKNDSFDGGIYMDNNQYVKILSKPLSINNAWAYGIGGHNVALKLYNLHHVGLNLANGSYTWGIYSNANGCLYFGRRAGSEDNTLGDYALIVEGAGGAMTYYGNFRATGAVAARSMSDIRLKENIVPIQNALSTIGQLHPFYHTWNNKAYELDKDLRKGVDVGLSAQESKEIYPFAVGGLMDTGYMVLEYTKFIPLTIAAINELNGWKDEKDKEIEVLKDKVKQLENQLKAK